MSVPLRFVFRSKKNNISTGVKVPFKYMEKNVMLTVSATVVQSFRRSPFVSIMSMLPLHPVNLEITTYSNLLL